MSNETQARARETAEYRNEGSRVVSRHGATVAMCEDEHDAQLVADALTQFLYRPHGDAIHGATDIPGTIETITPAMPADRARDVFGPDPVFPPSPDIDAAEADHATALNLLVLCALIFRGYEQAHIIKLEGSDSTAYRSEVGSKARRNGAVAKRIEDYLGFERPASNTPGGIGVDLERIFRELAKRQDAEMFVPAPVDRPTTASPASREQFFGTRAERVIFDAPIPEAEQPAQPSAIHTTAPPIGITPPTSGGNEADHPAVRAIVAEMARPDSMIAKALADMVQLEMVRRMPLLNERIRPTA